MDVYQSYFAFSFAFLSFFFFFLRTFFRIYSKVMVNNEREFSFSTRMTGRAKYHAVFLNIDYLVLVFVSITIVCEVGGDDVFELKEKKKKSEKSSCYLLLMTMVDGIYIYIY